MGQSEVRCDSSVGVCAEVRCSSPGQDTAARACTESTRRPRARSSTSLPSDVFQTWNLQPAPARSQSEQAPHRSCPTHVPDSFPGLLPRLVRPSPILSSPLTSQRLYPCLASASREERRRLQQEQNHSAPTPFAQTHNTAIMSQPSLAQFVMKRPWMMRWAQPLSNWYLNSAGYRQLGLRYGTSGYLGRDHWVGGIW